MTNEDRISEIDDLKSRVSKLELTASKLRLINSEIISAVYDSILLSLHVRMISAATATKSSEERIEHTALFDETLDDVRATLKRALELVGDE
ncbi:hypothetical protein SAMN04244548_01213 [Paracoccus pantotrophus]|nr:hypothetical protein SAMN04244548_01213 [Paracoccus pantotrophus]